MNNTSIRLSSEEEAAREVATWSLAKQVDIITQCLTQAAERAAKSNDPIHWAVVDGWEKRLMETIASASPTR